MTRTQKKKEKKRRRRRGVKGSGSGKERRKEDEANKKKRRRGGGGGDPTKEKSTAPLFLTSGLLDGQTDRQTNKPSAFASFIGSLAARDFKQNPDMTLG